MKSKRAFLGVLGHPDEVLLSKSIELIDGVNSKRNYLYDNLIENRVPDPDMKKEQRLFIDDTDIIIQF